MYVIHPSLSLMVFGPSSDWLVCVAYASSWTQWPDDDEGGDDEPM
jgi:hypothetical protein